ncbi:PREDICTED: prolyl 4-hydroxylase subunit alpha-2-like isoform X2 [Amphimedon queenslandica]|uniref:procollagen-proline 4-dioxygenase n=1 Tax=Amphimedon queenslandica TaxID=400682 RepID=A0AAN0IXI2_AMPQE|nr:PREDICTED: prolyl 4-hydroxylase subunit alpha-2-like isoform X2 [Amphimedon queenslandica]|eukprot:XP_019849479.1 PREDICTED: prolyl 4-hydroxylase subunit alpha-2-like isoform X2 [Amphimedon queenslandica]
MRVPATILFSFILLGTDLLSSTRGEMFTALIHMEGLQDIERNLLSQLHNYIAKEKEKLKVLESFAKRVEGALDTMGGDIAQHLHDPVNAFQLTNRFTNGWMKMHEIVYSDNGQDFMANISVNRHSFPTEEDYSGAMTALRRLQDTYRLKPTNIAQGKLSDKGLPMSSFDCYTIGKKAYNEKNWRHTRDWMLAALERFDEEGGDPTGTVDIPSIYDHLSFAEYSLGNIKKASQYTRELLQHDPSHERAISNREYFNRVSREEPDKFVDHEGVLDDESEHAVYEKLCREPAPIPSHLHKKLICYYFNNKRNPRLILSPIKTEVAFVKPKIYIFYDIVTDREIERLKELANPKLNRATATNVVTGIDEPVEYRISKSGWLSGSDDPLGYVDRIDQRIEDVTGLTMSTAEQLQVVNYGIGGQYEPHYDFARTGEDTFTSLGSGNRISTLLIYMSDVEKGGATVFPGVGARLVPIKRAAAYWWNLKRSGDGDYSTRHAGCPVLVGSKWVCNKWIHERGQEFRRPCGLSRDV